MKRIVFYNLVLIFTGMCFGVFAYFGLSETQSLILQDFFTQSTQQIVADMPKNLVIEQIVRQNFSEMGRMYLFGLCLLGVPILFIIVFIQGFSFGFLCCFLGGQSVFLPLIQFCYLPVYVGAASVAVSFARILLYNQIDNPWRQVVKYTFYFFLILLVVFLLSCLDGLISLLIFPKII